jgi:Tfp pilus assembly protein PilN
MRPINLIPAEERRGENAPLRSGPLAYIVLGALVALLVGVVVLVLTDNQITDRKNDVARLEREDAAATARARRLAAYTQFRTLHEQRVATVTSLADSRFDWERVMRELSLVLPDDVWLVSLSATASPNVSFESGSGEAGGGESDLRASAPGPALELTGCATGQEAVAGFVTALKDIDGVTRVGVESSELPDQGEGAGSTGGGSGGSEGGSEDCRTRQFIAKFSLVVAFDAAPVPVTASSAEAAPVSATEESEAAAEETAKEGTEEGSEGSKGSG